MSYKALFASIVLAVAWTGAALWATRSPAPLPPRHYIISAGSDSYSIQAHETRFRDTCTIFVRDGQEIAGVCGTHTWSEMVETDEPAPKEKVF